MEKTCTYHKTKSDGYGTTWRSQCGHRVYCEVPEEVGFSLAPLPNDDGRVFCPFCGYRIRIAERK